MALGGWVNGWGGCLGVPHTHADAHVHTCMCGKHDNFMQMATPLGESLEIPYDVLCVCMHVCACACVWEESSHTPFTPHPPTPRGTSRISQNSIALELIKIFQFCLKIWNLWRLPHPWVGVWFGGWVGRWVS